MNSLGARGYALALAFAVMLLLDTASAQTSKTRRVQADASGSLSPEKIAAQAKKAVVLIQCRSAGEVTSFGSGFVVDRLGLIATNAHVAGACDELIASTGDPTSARRATLVALDADRDVAIVLAPDLATSALSLGTSEGVRPGQKVFAIGHPEGLEYSFSDGLISSIREFPFGRYIQFTAPISPGSSGGPLLDAKARAIGMTTASFSEGQNLNFAVPAEYVAELNRAALSWLRSHPSASSSTGKPKDLEIRPILPPLVSAQSAARMGRSFRKAKNYDGAKALLEAANDRFPDNPDLLLQLAELNLDQNRLDHAAAFANRLLQVASGSSSGHACIAQILYHKGKISEARSEAEKCLSLNPDAEYAAGAHRVLADCAATGNDFASAAGHLAKTLEYSEARRDPVVHVHYAVSLLQAGRAEEADSEAKIAASLAPRNGYVKELLKAWRLPRGPRVVSMAEEWDPQQIYFVKGVVTNEGSEHLEQVRVIAELRDPKSVLIGTGQGYVVPPILGPGESGSFRIMLAGSFNAPSPAPQEPYPDVINVLGPRPTVVPAAGSRGSVLSAVTSLIQARQVAAQQEWDSKRSELISQWEARRQGAPKQQKTGNTYFAYVARD